MKSTKRQAKCRQLSEKEYRQKVNDVHREYAEEHVVEWIDEDNSTVRISLDSDLDLMARVLHMANLNAAYLKVKKNKGAGGIDGMSVVDMFSYIRDNQDVLLKSLRDGKYKPNPVRRVEIPKGEPGKFRKLGIPTVIDRVFQQAIAQVLSPIYEHAFSEYSYGFRPGRSCHTALKQLKEYADEGYTYVVDLDLEKYFDTVCHSRLVQILSETIKDGRLVSLIHKYLKAGVWVNGMFERTDEGVPQGGPLSPLLGNIMLNELDWELERRGHKFVRYADDTMILCKSQKAAERTLESITKFIEEKLYLKVNREKTCVARLWEVKYLGFGFYFKGEECRFRVHPKTVTKLKQKLRDFISRDNHMSDEERISKWNKKVAGWINYYYIADMKALLKQIDGWIRRRIRALYWRRWKRVRTRYKVFRSLGVDEWRVHELANMRSGPWASAMALNCVLTNEWIENQGFRSLSNYYLAKTRQN